LIEETGRKDKKNMSKWPDAGTFGYILTFTSQA
jgi:hypothetical protein